MSGTHTNFKIKITDDSLKLSCESDISKDISSTLNVFQDGISITAHDDDCGEYYGMKDEILIPWEKIPDLRRFLSKHFNKHIKSIKPFILKESMIIRCPNCEKSKFSKPTKNGSGKAKYHCLTCEYFFDSTLTKVNTE